MPIMQIIKSKCSHCDYQYTYWQGDVLGGLAFTKDVSCPKCKNGKVKIPLSEMVNFNISLKTLYHRLKKLF